MAESYPDWLVGRWKIRMVGAQPVTCAHFTSPGIVWEFQPDGVFIEHIPGSELYVTGYLYRNDPGTLYILRFDSDRELRPEGYRVTPPDGGRMFLERPDQGSEHIYLFEAERLTEPGC